MPRPEMNPLKWIGLVAVLSSRLMAAEPSVSLVLGGSQSTPFGPSQATADYGTRAGLSISTSLMAGALRLPLDIGLGVRRVSIGFSDWFAHDEFTDLQMPFVFHGALPFWKRLEVLVIWSPTYTLTMVSESSFGGTIPATESLRTRFNMGWGAGLQLDMPWGFRLRGHWVYNLFSPYPASRLTWSDGGIDLLLPLLWKRGAS